MFWSLRPAQLHRIALRHGVHGEVLADVAQEADQVQLREPVEVVHHARRVRAREIEEALELPALSRDVGFEQLGGEQVALGGLAARVADHARAAADHRDRVMSRTLQPHQRQHGKQAAHVQAVRGRIESDVRGHRARAQQFDAIG
jgi:hypothetical protein